MKNFLKGLCILAVLIAIVIMLVRGAGGRGESSSSVLKPGDEAGVVVKQGEIAFVATEYLWLLEYDKYRKAQDYRGMAEMESKKRIIRLEENTVVHIITVKSGYYEARINSGSHSGEKCFLLAYNVVPFSK